ncbi:haloacid dehalogenase type II [Exiguobacterium qingdaonense]|uniref:haloacid dehalogenase type II n=1 Tax=Exiguobacterium qingdaonense TaxID=2751251 RepID=UPI001BEC62E5|nr:haloacid dehalogenase type II [Exiguobacterium qingdaonense]
MKRTIKAIVFDVYGTLFDVHSVKDACEQEFPEKGTAISQVWRTKQLEYFFLRHMMGRYEDFDIVTRDALRYALDVHDATSTEDIEQRLIESYAHLTPYEEVESVLKELHDVKTVILSNGTDKMLEALLRNAGLADYFDEVVSIDGIKQPKPTPAAYMHWFKTSGLRRDEVLFLSSNGWDIAGAKSFGFHTAWINRNDLPFEQFDVKPDATYRNLTGISEWIQPASADM